MTRNSTGTVTPEDIVTIAEELDPRFGPMAWIGVVTGLRWGEVTGLRVSDVDLLRKRIAVRGQVTRGQGGSAVLAPPKSEAGIRELCIPVELAESLGEHISALGLTGADTKHLLFPHTSGGPLDYAGAPTCRHRSVRTSESSLIGLPSPGTTGLCRGRPFLGAVGETHAAYDVHLPQLHRPDRSQRL